MNRERPGNGTPATHRPRCPRCHRLRSPSAAGPRYHRLNPPLPPNHNNLTSSSVLYKRNQHPPCRRRPKPLTSEQTTPLQLPPTAYTRVTCPVLSTLRPVGSGPVPARTRAADHLPTVFASHHPWSTGQLVAASAVSTAAAALAIFVALTALPLMRAATCALRVHHGHPLRLVLKVLSPARHPREISLFKRVFPVDDDPLL